MIPGIFLGYLANMSIVLDEKTLRFFFDGFQGLAALELERHCTFFLLPVFRLKSTFTVHIDEGFMQSGFCNGGKGATEICKATWFLSSL